MMNSHTLINVLMISFLGFEQCVNIVSGVNNSSVHSTTTALGRNLSSTTKGLVHGSAVSSNSTSSAAGLPTRTFTTTKIKSSEPVSSFSLFSSSVSVNVSSQSSPPLTPSVGKPQATTSDYRNTSTVLLPSTTFLPFSLSDSVSLSLSSSLTPSLSSLLSRSNYSSNVSSLYSSSSSSSSFFPSSFTFSSPSSSSDSSFSLSIFPSASVPSTNSSLLLDNSLYSSSFSSFFFPPSSFTFYSPSSSSDSSFSLSIFPSASVPSTNSSLLLKNSLYSSSISVNTMSYYSSLSTNTSQSMLPSLVLTTPVSESMSSQFMPTSQLTSSLSSVFPTTVSSHSSFFPRQSTTRNISLSSSTIFTVLLASRTHVNKIKSSSLYTASEATMFTSLVKSAAPTVSSSRYTAAMPSPSRGNIPTVSPMLLEFNGELIVSVKHPSKLSIYDFKGISDSIERTLDDAFKPVLRYLYSKVMQIITQKHGRIECHFTVFIKGPSQETSDALKERLNKYNSTKGFGEFTLHSVETSVGKKSPDNDELKLWTIIVIAALGVLCLLLAVLLLCLVRRIKKLKAKKDISKHQDDNGIKEFQRYSKMFDSGDETQNIPLKLTKPHVSATDSRKPLKSDTTGTDSGAEGSLPENGEIRKMSESSSSSGGDDNENENENENEDEKTSVQEPELPDNSLQINEVTEEDETKFSTFSRKR